ncbi:MAG: hypothetical protein ACXACX_13635 [Candidatus Hodarchaeales archaeon]|jgi:hypothetical protein
MEMIKYLSIILSEEVKLSPSACGGLIRLAIKDEIGPFKPIRQLDLKDYKTSCANALKERLKKLSVDNIDQIIERLVNELIQNQSIITMEKV